MPNSPVIDPDSIANLRALSPDDGDVFLKEILEIFMDDTPKRISELHACLASGDVKTFTRAAHSIKGSSSNVGAMELRAVAETLEHKSRQQGLENVPELVAELEACFIRAEAELRKITG